AAVFGKFWNLIKSAGSSWIDDKVPRLGAAVSYYTVFAIPPLFVIILFIPGLVMNPDKIRSEMFSEVGGLIGGRTRTQFKPR
ncbi:MAG TPA: hypothetical protein VK327_02800, partial [Candidatus Paceibacterota bacterium]|nr:hypothetical protein [Candidatus Paceibacterota bacterium]